MINSDSEIKIIDFGLSRTFTHAKDPNFTQYVATRNYRAPEVMFQLHGYSKCIDLWSVGCILAEMINRRPLFDAKSEPKHLEQMVKTLGTNQIDLSSSGSEEEEVKEAHTSQERSKIDLMKQRVSQFKYQEGISFKALFPTATDECRDLLKNLLMFNP